MRFHELQKWQLRRLISIWLFIVIIGGGFIFATSSYLYEDKKNDPIYYKNIYTPSKETVRQIDSRSKDATPVLVGTYLENFREFNIKANNYRVVFLTWFKWKDNDELDMHGNFRIFKGAVNKMDTVKDIVTDEGIHYQLFRCDVTVNKSFWTRRFPLESHQLGLYLESTLPIEQVVFQPDMENSAYNTGMSISGYDLTKVDHATTAYQYPTTNSDPELKEAIMTSEFVTAIELNRSSWGVYLKCIIALFGTITWVLLVLYLNTYHRIDPLAMIPAALFGTVSNIMVAANLLPDALDTGLIEFINILGIMVIIAVALVVITINRIRSKYEDRLFAKFFGRIMFFTILALVIIGFIALPCSSYIFH